MTTNPGIHLWGFDPPRQQWVCALWEPDGTFTDVIATIAVETIRAVPESQRAAWNQAIGLPERALGGQHG